ncbi:hypothetical protein AB0I72_19335 [Nocardiopsis sp. NPDC049922]|uniref:hypothetical protein n=1 Tax=Nocardiopsis sp. NPDC049922 TaxID=3155157 RepID=UPI0033DC2E5F
MERTYYDPGGRDWLWWRNDPTPRNPRSEDEIRHGYTLADIEEQARWAAASSHFPSADFGERYRAAYDAILDTLLTEQDPPSPTYLRQMGRRGVDDVIGATLRHRGAGRWADDGHRPVGFERYWWFAARHTPSPEDRVVDAQTVAQIWPLLVPRQRRALWALSITGDYQQAADLLGIKYQSLAHNVRTARIAFLELWHEGETPSRLWMRDRRMWRRDVTHVAEHRPTTVRFRAAQRRRAAR